ncbi:MAG TPA: hypothetical protein VM597_05200 [Gemmataceae bacterium]|nr:hypothetical protein [Gemmataceae bacterium]
MAAGGTGGGRRGVARLVLEAFDGPPPFPGVRVGYRDGDEGNVRRDNLVWA